MKLGDMTNGINIEEIIQESLERKIKEYNSHQDKRQNPSPKLKYIRELLVREVQRRPDFLILKDRRLANVEVKCNAIEELFHQLRDNARYCNYSFALIPDYCLTPKWFKAKLVELNYGLLIYNRDKKIVTEVFEAHNNKNIDKKLRHKIVKIINEQNNILRRTK